MTLVRLGYVAMSIHLQNCSPSQTMTFAQYSKILDKEAAIRKLERIAQSNLVNCLRLLRYNLENEIYFFRLSSKLIPLANHEALEGWDFYTPIQEQLAEIKEFLKINQHIRVDFHPDHFVILNSPKKEIFEQSLEALQIHLNLLRGMGIHEKHRCILHVGGRYKDKDQALEQFINNFSFVPRPIQSMLVLENDDKVFTLPDILYLCEKLGLPIAFDIHHHQANNDGSLWEHHWDRITASWANSNLPLKIHISSPRSESNFRAHADYIEAKKFESFLHSVKGTVEQIDVMIEAKQKDGALFQLVRDLKSNANYEWVNNSSFYVK